MVRRATILMSITALVLVLGACGGPALPGTTVDPEMEGTWNLDFAGTDYSSSSAEESYAAGWWDSSTGDLMVWIYTDYAYSGGSTQDGYGVWYINDASSSTETVYVYDYGATSTTVYMSEDSAAVTADLNPQVGGTFYQGVGVGKITGSISAMVTEAGTTSTTNVSVTGLDAVLYDYGNYTSP